MRHAVLLAASLLVVACSNAGSVPPPTATHANGTVEGTYRVKDQDVAIKYVFVAKGDHDWEGHSIYDLVFTEKDASAEPSVDAITYSDDYGAILKVTEYKESDSDYSIISESYHHPGLQQKHPGGSGTMYLKNVSIANGEISGELYTKPGASIFDQPLVVDLKFKAAMPK